MLQNYCCSHLTLENWNASHFETFYRYCACFCILNQLEAVPLKIDFCLKFHLLPYYGFFLFVLLKLELQTNYFDLFPLKLVMQMPAEGTEAEIA